MLTDAAIEGKIDRLLGLKENVIIGKLIPAATGLKRDRNIEISPSEPIVREAYERDTLLQALEEIGQDGGAAIDFGTLDLAAWLADTSANTATPAVPEAVGLSVAGLGDVIEAPAAAEEVVEEVVTGLPATDFDAELGDAAGG